MKFTPCSVGTRLLRVQSELRQRIVGNGQRARLAGQQALVARREFYRHCADCPQCDRAEGA
jgi:hypothetical protein